MDGRPESDFKPQSGGLLSHEEQLDPKVKGQIQGCDWLPPETELKAQKKQKFTIDDEDCLKSTRTRKDVIISKTSDKKKNKSCSDRSLRRRQQI